MPKKKQKIDIESLNPDDVLKDAVASGITGRILASYASILTNREISNRKAMYLLLKAGKEYSQKLPVTADISEEEKELKEYTPAEAIEEFKEKYPIYAQPLLKLLEKKKSKTVPVFSYGLKSEKNLSRSYYVGLLTRALSISREKATLLYEKIIRPEFKRQREESGLVKIAMKE